MTLSQKAEYERFARETVTKAGLELVEVYPEDDYIEIFCPECETRRVLAKRDLSDISCVKCRKRQQEREFHKESKWWIDYLGFILNYSSFEEDYIEIECPDCGKISSFHFEEIDTISCRACTMKKVAQECGFDLYWEDDSWGEPWEEQLESWQKKNPDTPAVLVCKTCDMIHIINADQMDAIEQIRKLKCRCDEVRSGLGDLIARQGFSVEFKSSPTGSYVLQSGEFALLCNRCGKEVVFGFDDENIRERISSLHCSNSECGLEPDPVIMTRTGRMCWCYDALLAIYSTDLTNFNGFSFENGTHLNLKKEDREVYFAVDPEYNSHAYAFVIYPGETDKWLSKYLLFRFEIASWGVNLNADINIRWPDYYDELYEAIRQDIECGSQRGIQKAENNFNHYIRMYNSIYSQLLGFRWIANRLLSIYKKLKIPDPNVCEFLRLHICPVCGKPHTSEEKVCLNCGFADLNRVFINRDEAEYWKEHVMLPYKEKYESER